MIYYLLANCFSALSGVINKYFIRHGYYDPGTQMLDVTFHANAYNVIFYFILYFYYKKQDKIDFSLKKTFFSKRELGQIILFAIPIYAAALKLKMFHNMPISYVEISAMIKPFIVLFLALLILKEKFYSYYLIYASIAICGFLVSNYDKVFNGGFSNGSFTDLQKITYYIIIAAIGDITRRYYCRKWNNSLQAICVEVMIFFIYGMLYLSFYNRLSLNILLNPCTIVYAMVTFSHHICIILGVQMAKSVAALEIVNFSKIIFSLLFCVLILGERPSLMRIYGAIIIAIAIILFNNHRRRNEMIDKNNNENKNENDNKIENKN